VTATFRPSRAHEALGPELYDVVTPATFPKHVLRFRNQRAAERVGLGALTPAEWEAHFARFEPLAGSFEKPLALRYHGHQFGSYNPQLGDGRGFLFAQLIDPVDGRLLDLGTKGSGKTPYSRGGDGRLTLKGGVREILATEMLEARGVKTSRTFSLFETGEWLQRGDEPSPTRSSVLVRLSHSHVRFGTFQRLAHLGKTAEIRKLIEHCAEHYLPEIQGATNLPMAFLEAVRDRSADLVASWMAAGFVHGVLNTDNMVVTGESFDYGPWRFAPTWDASFTAAYFDESGLYAFGRQPRTVLWNLLRLSEAVRAVAADVRAEPVMSAFDPLFEERFVARFVHRMGLAPRGADEDRVLVASAIAYLGETHAPIDRFFHRVFGGPARGRFDGPPSMLSTGVLLAMEHHAPRDPKLLAHPLLAEGEPCSMLIDEVEALWSRIAEDDDWAPLHAKIDAIRAAAPILGA
jgi:uncharacterized protein YdiU (UPF0061 family)